MADLLDIFRRTSGSLAAEFALVRAIPHRGESGRATEEALKVLLRKHLPARFAVTGGFVVGRDGTQSHQADVVVIDAINCPRLLQSGEIGLYPVDGVVGLIEVTQTLTSAKRGEDLSKIAAFRSLPSSFEYSPDFRDSGPLGVIFAERSDVALRAHAEALAEAWRQAPTNGKGALPNAILVLGDGLVVYHNATGQIHCDPYNAVGSVCISDADSALLLLLLLLLDRFRFLIEHRIRAQAHQILSIRTINRPRSDASISAAMLSLEAMGAEPYFPSLESYFSIEDRAALDRLLAGRIETVSFA